MVCLEVCRFYIFTNLLGEQNGATMGQFWMHRSDFTRMRIFYGKMASGRKSLSTIVMFAGP